MQLSAQNKSSTPEMLVCTQDNRHLCDHEIRHGSPGGKTSSSNSIFAQLNNERVVYEQGYMVSQKHKKKATQHRT